MAKAWQDFGKKLDDEAKDALFASGFNYDSYSSDEERIRAALDMLYHTPLWKKARYDDLKRMRNKYAYDEKGVDPFDISNAASIIGSWKDQVGEDGKTKLTQGDQFYSQYWKADKNQREYWKDIVEGKLGSGAWNKVKERMNERLKADAANEAARNRTAYLEGKAEDQGASDWLASAWWRMFSGRTKDKMLANKKVDPKDVTLDVLEDVAMTLPLGAATLPGKIATAAAVPMGSEILDALAYDVPTQNEKGEFDPEDLKNMNPNDLPERATFNPIDVAVGTVTNLAVPGLMNMAAKRVGNKLIGNNGQHAGLSKDIMEIVQKHKNLGDWKVPTADNGNPANTVASLYMATVGKLEDDAYRTTKAERNLMQPEEWAVKKDQLIGAINTVENGVKSGNKKLVQTGQDQIDEIVGNDKLLTDKQYYGNASILDEIKQSSPEHARKVIESLPYNTEANKLASINPNLSTIDEEKALKNAYKYEGRANWLTDVSLEPSEKIKKSKKTKALEDAKEKAGIEWHEAIESGDDDAIYATAVAYDLALKAYISYMEKALKQSKEAGFKALTPSEKILAGLETDNPALVRALQESDASMEDLFRLSYPGRLEKAEKYKNIVSNFVGNKVGNQSHAEKALAPVDSFLGTSVSKEAKKKQEAWKNEDKRNQSKAILESMALASGNDEDKKWLRKIADKPGIVKGYGEGNTNEFRKWFLTRGSDILRGTELFRPTPAAE